MASSESPRVRRSVDLSATQESSAPAPAAKAGRDPASGSLRPSRVPAYGDAMASSPVTATAKPRRLPPSRVPAAAQGLTRAGRQVRQVVSSPGRPLNAAELSVLGPASGGDFSAVRMHDDSVAAASADAVDADMYTSGTHIVAGDSYTGPGTAYGRQTLTHELYHVMQQSQGPSRGGRPATG